MGQNAPAAYGTDFRCSSDTDTFFSTCTGLEAVQQSAFHRLTTDDVLGDDGTGTLAIVGWGFDVRRLLGIASDQAKLTSFQPILVEKLLRDPRLDAADVTLTATKTKNGLADVALKAVGHTADGPFTIDIKSVRALVDLGGAS